MYEHSSIIGLASGIDLLILDTKTADMDLACLKIIDVEVATPQNH